MASTSPVTPLSTGTSPSSQRMRPPSAVPGRKLASPTREATSRRGRRREHDLRGVRIGDRRLVAAAGGNRRGDLAPRGTPRGEEIGKVSRYGAGLECPGGPVVALIPWR